MLKKTKNIICIIVFTTIILFGSCTLFTDKNESGFGNKVKTIKITVGMPYQGGIVAYILQPGDPGYIAGQTHGIIAATEDQSTGMQWWNNSYNKIVTGTALGTGQANTTAIVNNQGAGSYAAKLCDDYTNIDTGTGVYSDWYLPSKDELGKLYQNQAAVGGFAVEVYWSSSQFDDLNVWYVYFNGGGASIRNSDHTQRVRAVRSF